MAKFIATRDQATGEVILKSGDQFSIPSLIWSTLTDGYGPYKAEWSRSLRAFRLNIAAGTDAVAWLRSLGHRVTTVEAGETRPTPKCSCGADDCRDNAVPAPDHIRELIRSMRVGRPIE